MKILKGCFSFIFCFFAFIILTLTLTLSSVTSVALSPKVITRFISQLDAHKIVLDVTAGFKKELETKRDPGQSGEPGLSTKDIDQYVKDITDNLTESDVNVLKKSASSNLTEAFNYLKNDNKKEMTFNIRDARRILLKLLINTPNFDKQMGLPKPICRNGNTRNCIKQDDFMDLMEKALSGNLTRPDIEKVIPICKTKASKGCMSEKDVNKLIRDTNSNKKNKSTLFENENGDITITQAELSKSNALQTIRHILSNLNLIYFGLLSIVTILMLLVVLMQRKGALIWILSVNILSAIVLTGLIVAARIGFNTLSKDQFSTAEYNSIDLSSYLNKIGSMYRNALTLALIERIAFLILISVLIYLGFWFIKRKKTGENEPKINKEVKTNASA